MNIQNPTTIFEIVMFLISFIILQVSNPYKSVDKFLAICVSIVLFQVIARYIVNLYIGI